ncbi:molybdopterin-dependent oxidoreductase [Nocardia sp. R7R-8]|uniref:molybdopterin-dependent oxidoreductase n=1 Tax=Nocardia sp. R7R-8 TaxID=3459304 RepID=UPI00403DABB5
MVTQEKVTFCRICEPACGLVGTVEKGKLLTLRPDDDHPLSSGFACPKGIAYASVQNDPDRVLYPMRRQPDGSFQRVSWDEAMHDIIGRVRGIREKYGAESLGWYTGNPGGLNYSHLLWTFGIVRALGISHWYCAASQDTHSRSVASHLLYGHQMVVPLPDLEAAETVVILGANPVVSHGSLASIPRFADKLRAVENRGGRVIVIDPRRTETARLFEWTPITPDADAWLLLSMLHVLFGEELFDAKALAACTGHRELRAAAARFAPEATEARTSIPAGVVRDLTRRIAGTRAVLYGRTGTCLGTSATLVNCLMDAVNLVAGNLDSSGGAIFGDAVLPMREVTASTYNTRRSRIGNLPEVSGMEPAANMVAEIRTPGRGQIRAMFIGAGNPVVSTPGGRHLGAALDELDLVVSLDLYITETSAHAHYVLPATAMYEREDVMVFVQPYYPKPFVQATEALVAPAGEARAEWEIIDQLARGLGTRALPSRALRAAAKAADVVGRPLTPQTMLNAMIRVGRGGDLFGLRPGGLTFDKLVKRNPHGILFAEESVAGRRRKVIRHRDRKVHFDHPGIWAEIDRLERRSGDPEFPFFLIGMRELGSENSWMHNATQLRAGRPAHAARMHPRDAEELGVVNTGRVRLVSRYAAIELPVLITEDIHRGVVAVPHGWGHDGTGRWSTANREGGVSVNDLMTTAPSDVDPLSGVAHLNGVRIRVERVETDVEKEV